MKPTKSTSDLARTIAAEHDALRREIRRLNTDLPDIGENESRGLQVLADLRGFQAHLVKHFELEEQGGYFGNLQNRDPGTEREVEDLLAEHRRFEQETGAMIDALAAHVEEGAELKAHFATELRAMLGRLAIHESKENALFQRVVTRDVGRAD